MCVFSLSQSFSPFGKQQKKKTLRDLCQSDLPLVRFFILCSLWPLRNQCLPPVSLLRPDVEELQLSLPPASAFLKVTESVICFLELLRMSESKMSPFGWVIYRKKNTHTINFSWFCVTLDTIIALFILDPSLCSRKSAWCLSSSPSSCPSVFHWYFLPSRLSVQLSIYVAFKLTTSDSVFWCFLLCFCLFVCFWGGSTLRNQLFCIYFIVIWVFSDLFFPFILSFRFHLGIAFKD